MSIMSIEFNVIKNPVSKTFLFLGRQQDYLRQSVRHTVQKYLVMEDKKQTETDHARIYARRS